MLLPRESIENRRGFRLRNPLSLAILFRPTRRKCCAMANSENTAVNELIARVSGGPTSSPSATPPSSSPSAHRPGAAFSAHTPASPLVSLQDPSESLDH